jgi:hypothetical protein
MAKPGRIGLGYCCQVTAPALRRQYPGHPYPGAVSAVCPTSKGLLVLHDGEVLLSKGGSKFAHWQARAPKDIEVTALYAASDLKSVLAGCAGGVLLRLE